MDEGRQSRRVSQKVGPLPSFSRILTNYGSGAKGMKPVCGKIIIRSRKVLLLPKMTYHEASANHENQEPGLPRGQTLRLLRWIIIFSQLQGVSV